MKRVVILTGAELRHTFFRKRIAAAEDIEVLRSYCEGTEKSLESVTRHQQDNDLRLMHLQAREQSEKDFFELFVEFTPDESRPVFIRKGEINSAAEAEAIVALKPDLLVSYGCSIIREPLLSAFPRRFVNIHLGLSPYYRGSGTNYWPLVNCEPEFVGATFMHIDAGVDTGEVIHQIRARVARGDTPVQIGNRLIVDMAKTTENVICNIEKLPKMPQIPGMDAGKVYRKKDYSEASVLHLYQNFRDGLVSRYLTELEARCAAAPIVRNPALTPARADA